MAAFEEKDYKVFELFRKQWAVVAAGTEEKFNAFTVSFLPAQYRKSLGILGTRSGRDDDKIAASGLTPIPVAGSLAFREAELTFVCRKIYQHQLTKADIAADVQDYYANDPKAYPVDQNGQWQPHWVFVGEIIEVVDRR